MLNTLTAAAFAIGCAGTALAAIPSRIDFTISPTEKRPGAVRLALSYRSATSSSNHSNPVALAELQGLSAAQLASGSGTPVRFRLVRDAGTLDCDGVARRGRGTGNCRFAANPGFAAELARRGIARPSADEQFQLALRGANLAVVDELARQGYAKPKPDDLVEAGIFGVTVERLRALDAVGYRPGSVDKLVEMSIHGVTPDYIRELAAIGAAYRGLSVDQLVEMRIHGVTPARVRAYADAGYTDLSRRQLVDMAIHGVTPAYLQEMAGAGLPRRAAGEARRDAHSRRQRRAGAPRQRHRGKAQVIDAARIVAREDGRRTVERFGEWLCGNLPVVSMILVALLLGALVGLA